ncbi:MAG: hypothetical protein ACI959_000886 [Limisphaerales bacterium]|jgi:hypothetical protein
MRIRTISVLIILLSVGGIVIALALQTSKISDQPLALDKPPSYYETTDADVDLESTTEEPTNIRFTAEGCVFNTVFGEESSDSFYIYNTPQKALSGMSDGLKWLASAQLPNGGFGAGSHSAQHIKDPHAVPADPATTSMVAMAILRTVGLNDPEWKTPLNNAINFLISEVENSDPNNLNITSVTGTQIQGKLGQNIDVVMTAQFFSNLLQEKELEKNLKLKVQDVLQSCVNRIESSIDENGTVANSGWAGVLQSSFANNALESAQVQGINVDNEILEKTRDFNKGNVDVTDGSVKTEMGAGVVLYSVSGSSRASAKQARKARDEVTKAKNNGLIEKDEEVSVSSLMDAGFDKEDALELSTSYQVYESAKVTAQDKKVMSGYGNNGGEEFLSFLQTGESLVVNRDHSWKNWYSDISGKLITIQNQDGSWNGHHCITSPVFCTATCLLVLSIQNDLKELVALGEE